MATPNDNSNSNNLIPLNSINMDVIDNTIIFSEQIPSNISKAFKLSTIFSQAVARGSAGADSDITSDEYFGQMTMQYNLLGWVNHSAGIASIPLSNENKPFLEPIIESANGLTSNTSLSLESIFNDIKDQSQGNEDIQKVMDYWWESSLKEQGKINFGIGILTLGEHKEDDAEMKCMYYNFDVSQVYNKKMMGSKKEFNRTDWKSLYKVYSHQPNPYNAEVRTFTGHLKYDDYLKSQEALEHKISPAKQADHFKSFSFL